MSEDLLFAKIAEPDMTDVTFSNHFRNRMGEIDRGHLEVSPKLWNLRPSDNKNGETTRIPRLITSYQKMRKETEDWGDYMRLTEEIAEFPLSHRMLLGADSVVHTSRLKAFETNQRRMAKFSDSMDPNFIGRKAAVLHYKQFAYVDESTRRRMSNAATPKPGRFEEKWAKLDLALIVMRGLADLQEAALKVAGLRPELVTSGKLLTRTALEPFDEQEDRQPEEATEHNTDLAGKDDDKASVGGALSQDFKLLDENEEGTETLAGSTESAKDEISMLEPLSALAFMNAAHNLPESNSPGKN